MASQKTLGYELETSNILMKLLFLRLVRHMWQFMFSFVPVRKNTHFQTFD